MIIPLIDPRCAQLGITVQPPGDLTRRHWEVKYVWLTTDGKWDGVPDWAKPFQTDKLGGAFHVYALALGLDGKIRLTPDLLVLRWPDGSQIYSPKEGDGGWGNVPINAGFNWQRGEIGPYQFYMNAISTSVVKGLGLPWPGYPWLTAAGADDATVRYWDGRTWIGPTPFTASHPLSVLGGQHTSYFIVAQECEAQIGPPPSPPDDHATALLAKAEKIADILAEDRNTSAQAAHIYLGIAGHLLSADRGLIVLSASEPKD